MNLPENFKLVFNNQQINEVTSKVANQISLDYVDKDLMVLSILRGGIFFFTNLTQKLKIKHQISFIKTKSYSGINRENVKLEIIEYDFKDRDVLLVDDICDSGNTLLAVKDKILSLGAKSVKSSVLIHRLVKDQVVTPDYVGFLYPGDEWFVGYGCDDNGYYASLPDLYVVK